MKNMLFFSVFVYGKESNGDGVMRGKGEKSENRLKSIDRHNLSNFPSVLEIILT